MAERHRPDPRHRPPTPPPTPRAMKSGTRSTAHRDVVLDRAAFGVLHFARRRGACARRACRLLERSGDRRVRRRRPRPAPRRSARSSSSRASSSLAAGRNLHQHVPGMRRVERIARARQVVAQQLDQRAAASARSAVSAAARRARAPCAKQPQRGRRAGDPGDGHAPARAGCGKSFRTAAVTMPSVPSAPMKSCFRS